MVNYEPTEDWPNTVVLSREKIGSKDSLSNEEVINILFHLSRREEEVRSVRSACRIAAQWMEDRMAELPKEIAGLKAQEEFERQT
jgi:hypothetical protein